MNHTYEWLYDNYTKPLIAEITVSQNAAVKQLTEALALSETNAVILSDALTDMRLHWGAEIFAAGLQLGVRLMSTGNG